MFHRESEVYGPGFIIPWEIGRKYPMELLEGMRPVGGLIVMVLVVIWAVVIFTWSIGLTVAPRVAAVDLRFIPIQSTSLGR